MWRGGAHGATLALLCAVAAPGIALGAASPAKAPASASLEQCVTAVQQPARSATFVGEMNAIPGTWRMQMRIEVLERPPQETLFHAVTYPGLGVWLRSASGVKTFKNFDKVTDLSAPAVYRAAVHFRWLGGHGRVIRTLVLRTAHCEQPAPPAMSPAPA
jgi:hypothetical protein